MAPIAGVIKSHGVNHIQYADDTQLYIGLNCADSLSKVNSCFCSVQQWFTVNGLSLNPDKSEAFVIGTHARHRQEGDLLSVQLDSTSITTSNAVRALGVTFDTTMSFNKHINNICKISYCHIRALRHIRKSITTADANTIAVALVSSRLDYCNSLFYGTTSSTIRKLQRVQNAVARTIISTGNRSDVNTLLADLHWLPVKTRIDYKIALLTYKTLTTQRPSYLFELLQPNTPVKLLRSSSHLTLKNCRPRTTFGSRAFLHAAPAVWNSLPYSIIDNFSFISLPVFKRNLKTHFYSTCYST